MAVATQVRLGQRRASPGAREDAGVLRVFWQMYISFTPKYVLPFMGQETAGELDLYHVLFARLLTVARYQDLHDL